MGSSLHLAISQKCGRLGNKTMARINKEKEWDALLKIKTSGRDDSISNTVNYPYEPTDYVILERFANEGYVRKNNTLLDYGCGKGRVGFFMSYQTRCKSIGIDYDERMIQGAIDNKANAVSGNRNEFICENAAKYEAPVEVDRIYFFNPFSVEILEGVLQRVKDSYYTQPRKCVSFFLHLFTPLHRLKYWQKLYRM